MGLKMNRVVFCLQEFKNFMYFQFMKIILAQTAGFAWASSARSTARSNTPRSPRAACLPPGRSSITTRPSRCSGNVKVTTLDESRPVPPRSTILIRAHGVAPDVETSYRNTGHAIVDGTCPKVKTVHKVIEKYKNMGFAIIITGDEGHAEVIGLQGYAGNAGSWSILLKTSGVSHLESSAWFPRRPLIKSPLTRSRKRSGNATRIPKL